MRLRLDPQSRLALDGRIRSLGETVGACAPSNAGPLAAESTWGAWHTDGAWHRGLYVSDWPRLDVHATWLRDLMLYAGSVRTVAVFFEPVARSKSQRSIVRDAAKIESEAAHPAEKGFRVGAHHRRARQAVEQREEELVAGYGEFSYAGVVTVTAEDLDDLERATSDVIQIAAAAVPSTPPRQAQLDAAHELGHLVMHRDRGDQDRTVEQQAHGFAASFLMPRSKAADLLPRTLDSRAWMDLAELKRAWGVSIAALIRRMRDLRRLNDDEFKNAMKLMSARGWRRQEPGASSGSALPPRPPRPAARRDRCQAP